MKHEGECSGMAGVKGVKIIGKRLNGQGTKSQVAAVLADGHGSAFILSYGCLLS
jgi:hypothetical protein